jgi:AAA domain/Rubredoxin metal binding domain
LASWELRGPPVADLAQALGQKRADCVDDPDLAEAQPSVASRRKGSVCELCYKPPTVARERTLFSCQNCGYQTPKWLGRCPDCGQWESLVEERVAPSGKERRRAAATGGRPTPLSEIVADDEERRTTGIGELDRVLGGGMVAGSAILIGGDPGIGKSTLLLQATAALAASGVKTLYVSGEESAQQIRMRAERLGLGSSAASVFCETSLERILETAESTHPQVIAVDSIQTVTTAELAAAAGSIGQVRESAGRLVAFSKQSGAACFLVGHVTKEGYLAGPRVLEHMVDTVLYFEGDRGHPFRVLRAVKNRFGSTNEIGVFEMKDSGLAPVVNPSELFLSERPESMPSVVRRGVPNALGVTSAWSSTRIGRVPSIAAITTDPATRAGEESRASPDRPGHLPERRRRLLDRRARGGFGRDRRGRVELSRSANRPGDARDRRSRPRRRGASDSSSRAPRARGAEDGISPLHPACGERAPNQHCRRLRGGRRRFAGCGVEGIVLRGGDAMDTATLIEEPHAVAEAIARFLAEHPLR